MKYTLQYASNFFLNLQKKKDFQHMLKPCSENLALLGNIGSLDSYDSINRYKEFLTYTSYNWKNVYVVPGPYEYTSLKPRPFQHLLDELYKLENSYDNVRILNNSHADISNTDLQLIGSTTWLRTPYLKHPCMFEYAYIWRQNHQGLSQINGNDILNWHCEDIHYIGEAIKNNKRSIILSHHLPCGVFVNDIGRLRMEASNLEHMLIKPIEIWLGGAGNTSITGTLGICNDVFCGTNPYTSFNRAKNGKTYSYNSKAYMSLRTNIIELV